MPLKQPRIVIVGAGFGGLFCARGLVDANAQVTLIDCQNHHLFQPLLYQVATGFLGINDVALPVRSLFHSKSNVDVVMAEVTGIDTQSRRVLTDRAAYDYDYLVLATGARYHFFGRDAWAQHVQVLKTLEDAIGLRQQILSTFEQAELEQDVAQRKKLLTYVIIGGGPTGVEMVGAIADVVNYALPREFRRIQPKDAQIILIEAGPRLLSSMPKKISFYTQRILKQKGVDVRCNIAVQNIEHEHVTTTRGNIDSATILWAAGVRPIPIAGWLDVESDPRGAIPVKPDLSVERKKDVYVLGDAATVMQNGKPLPALASVAKQQGQYLAHCLKQRLQGKALKPFRYHDWGTMATIGRNEAAADFGRFSITGWLSWMVWGLVHIYFLTGFRNRIVVFLTWVWTYATFGMGARIILRTSNHR
jgi:NADH dehydrogenase